MVHIDFRHGTAVRKESIHIGNAEAARGHVQVELQMSNRHRLRQLERELSAAPHQHPLDVFTTLHGQGDEVLLAERKPARYLP